MSEDENGIPHQGFALVRDRDVRESWFFPHHQGGNAYRRLGATATVDVEMLDQAVRDLFPIGVPRSVDLGPEEVLAVCEHLAEHYRTVGRHLPDALAVIVR